MNNKKTKMTLRNILLASIVGMSIMSLSAETLEKALEATYKNNSELAERRAAVRATSERVNQAKSGWRPRIDASASLGLNKNINSGMYKDGTSGSSPSASGDTNRVAKAGVQLNQNIYQGGSTVAATKEAESAYLAAVSGLLAAEQDILLKAVQTYLELYAKMAELKLYRSNEDVFTKTLEATMDKFKVGEETRTSVAQAEAKLAEATATRKTAEAQLEGLRATFERLTGLHITNLEKPRDFNQIPAELIRAVEIAKAENPSIISAGHEEVASRHSIEKASAGLKPRVDVQLASNRTETRTRQDWTQLGDNHAGKDQVNSYNTNNSATVSVSMPIYEGGQIRSQTREAHQTAQQKRVAVETARRQVAEQITQFWENFKSATANIENYTKQVSASEVSLEGTRQEMLVGSKILLEVLRAQSDLLQAKLQLVNAEKTYYLEGFKLLAAMGWLTAEKLKLKVDKYSPDSYYREIKNRWY